MSIVQKTKKLIGYEPVFAVHCPNPYDPANDLHTIKAIAHYDDNTHEPVLLKKYGFKRPFYITKKQFQNHKEKKTYEHVDKLDRYECTQSELPLEICKRLGKKMARPNLRELGNSPFLYGTDILSTSLLKYKMKMRYKNITPTKRTMAVLDTEFSIKDGVLTICGVTMQDKWFIAVNKRLVEGYSDPLKQFHKACETYIKTEMDLRGIKSVDDIEIHFCDDEWIMLEKTAAKLHELKPDLVGIWGIKADIKKFQDVAERYKRDLGSIFSDPSVPDEFKFFKFKEGRDTHVAKSTRKMTLPLDKQWHTVQCPASFYFICLMSTYTHVRKGQSKVKMSLDACMYRHLKKTKFRFPEADNSPENWHIVMEREFPFVYMCYNLIDCVGPELLEEKTNDATVNAFTLAGFSDLEIFNSNPKILIDDLTIDFARSNNLIISSTPKERYDPFKGKTIDQRCNIVTLDTSLRTREGYRGILEMPYFNTNLYLFTFDSDVTGAYPGNQIIFNLCAEATYREVMWIEGICEQVKREQSINIAASVRNNALEVTQVICEAPTTFDMLARFREEHNLV